MGKIHDSLKAKYEALDFDRLTDKQLDSAAFDNFAPDMWKPPLNANQLKRYQPFWDYHQGQKKAQALADTYKKPRAAEIYSKALAGEVYPTLTGKRLEFYGSIVKANAEAKARGLALDMQMQDFDFVNDSFYEEDVAEALRTLGVEDERGLPDPYTEATRLVYETQMTSEQKALYEKRMGIK